MGHFPVSWLSGELSDGYEEKIRVVIVAPTLSHRKGGKELTSKTLV